MTPPKKDKPEPKKTKAAPSETAKKTPATRKVVARPAVRRTAAKATARKTRPKFDIGIDVVAPKKTCDDEFCPFHGGLPVRGQILEGTVVSDRMQRTVVVERQYMRNIEKYERLEKRFGRYLAHNPPCLEVTMDDRVKIMECRPLSKMVSFVVIEKTS